MDVKLRKEQLRKASELAELRDARKELKSKAGKREAMVKAKAEKGAPAIPSFLKVKAQGTAPEAKKARIEEAPTTGLGLGGYAPLD